MSPETESGGPEPAGEPRPVDLLAVMPHRDDAELLCGGTLIRAVDRGHRAGVLDLTRGETGTRGSAERRRDEAQRAARAMGLTARANAEFPDAGLRNDDPIASQTPLSNQEVFEVRIPVQSADASLGVPPQQTGVSPSLQHSLPVTQRVDSAVVRPEGHDAVEIEADGAEHDSQQNCHTE